MPRKSGIKKRNVQKEEILAEYNALRTEIIKRIELRNSILFGTLSFAGVLLGFGLTTPTLPLIYVIISMFLAGAWAQSDVLISNLGQYIRENLEYPQTGLNWEHIDKKYACRGKAQNLNHPSYLQTVVCSW